MASRPRKCAQTPSIHIKGGHSIAPTRIECPDIPGIPCLIVLLPVATIFVPLIGVRTRDVQLEAILLWNQSAVSVKSQRTHIITQTQGGLGVESLATRV